MGAPVFRAGSSRSGAGALARPTGTEAGDELRYGVLIATTGAAATPSGWTLVRAQNQSTTGTLTTFRRTATGTSADDVTAPTCCAALMVAFKGAQNRSDANNGNASKVAGSITPVTDALDLIIAGTSANTTYTTPTGYTAGPTNTGTYGASTGRIAAFYSNTVRPGGVATSSVTLTGGGTTSNSAQCQDVVGSKDEFLGMIS